MNQKFSCLLQTVAYLIIGIFCLVCWIFNWAAHPDFCLFWGIANFGFSTFAFTCWVRSVLNEEKI